jgi:hypothetical protein
VEKGSLHFWAAFVTIEKLPKIKKKLPNERKLDQSGHPGLIGSTNSFAKLFFKILAC